MNTNQNRQNKTLKRTHSVHITYHKYVAFQNAQCSAATHKPMRASEACTAPHTLTLLLYIYAKGWCNSKGIAQGLF